MTKTEYRISYNFSYSVLLPFVSPLYAHSYQHCSILCTIYIQPQHKNQMEVAINSSIQTLLGDDDGQFDNVLFAMGERVTDNEAVEDEEILSKDSDDDSVVNECCPICSKTCNSPNKLAKEEIRRCQNLLRVSGTKHFLRDNSVASTNLDDYLYPSIWCWHPQRLLSSNLRPLLCWNKSCSGHSGENCVYYITSNNNSSFPLKYFP